MTETPSGNRWEPPEDATQPLTPTPTTATPAATPTAGAPVVPPEYGWAPPPLEAERPRRERRRTGALVAGAAALVIGATAGGYAIGSSTAGSDRQDFGPTRQAPPSGFAPGQGFPDQDGRGGDDDQFDGPDGSSDGSSDDENS